MGGVSLDPGPNFDFCYLSFFTPDNIFRLLSPAASSRGILPAGSMHLMPNLAALGVHGLEGGGIGCWRHCFVLLRWRSRHGVQSTVGVAAAVGDPTDGQKGGYW